VGRSGSRSTWASASRTASGTAVARDGSALVVEECGLLVLQQQGEQFGRSGEPPERDRPELVGGRVGVAWGDDLGDPGQGGVDPVGVTSGDAGDHGPQAVLVGARGGDVPPAALLFGALLMQCRVGLDDLRLRHGEDPAARLAGDDPGDCAVDHADAVQRQVAGQLGDPAGDVDLGLTGLHDGPGEW